MCKFITLMPEFHGSRVLGEFTALKEAVDCGVAEGCHDRTCLCNTKGYNIKAVFDDDQSTFVVLREYENDNLVHGLAWHVDADGIGSYINVGSYRP